MKFLYFALILLAFAMGLGLPLVPHLPLFLKWMVLPIGPLTLALVLWRIQQDDQLQRAPIRV